LPLRGNGVSGRVIVVLRSTFVSVSIILLAALMACRAIFRGY
jgi:hypothetical protein